MKTIWEDSNIWIFFLFMVAYPFKNSLRCLCCHTHTHTHKNKKKKKKKIINYAISLMMKISRYGTVFFCTKASSCRIFQSRFLMDLDKILTLCLVMILLHGFWSTNKTFRESPFSRLKAPLTEIIVLVYIRIWISF